MISTQASAPGAERQRAIMPAAWTPSTRKRPRPPPARRTAAHSRPSSRGRTAAGRGRRASRRAARGHAPPRAGSPRRARAAGCQDQLLGFGRGKHALGLTTKARRARRKCTSGFASRMLCASVVNNAPRPSATTFSRPLRDLRISVTDRCNFRCPYCMPKEVFGAGYAFLRDPQLMTLGELTRIARAFHALGVEKIRLTGGEPLLRRGRARARARAEAGARRARRRPHDQRLAAGKARAGPARRRPRPAQCLGGLARRSHRGPHERPGFQRGPRAARHRRRRGRSACRSRSTAWSSAA